MSRMKETTAEELKGKRIKIVSDGFVYHQASFIRLDTNEPIQNVYRAHIDMEAGRIIRVTLWLIRVDYSAKQVNQEAVVCDNPELEITALASSEEAVNEEGWDWETVLVRSLTDENERLRAEIDHLKAQPVH
jgi:hypothetical protein